MIDDWIHPCVFCVEKATLCYGEPFAGCCCPSFPRTLLTVSLTKSLECQCWDSEQIPSCSRKGLNSLFNWKLEGKNKVVFLSVELSLHCSVWKRGFGVFWVHWGCGNKWCWWRTLGTLWCKEHPGNEMIMECNALCMDSTGKCSSVRFCNTAMVSDLGAGHGREMLKLEDVSLWKMQDLKNQMKW